MTYLPIFSIQCWPMSDGVEMCYLCSMSRRATVASAQPPTRQSAFDYDRTVVAFHGTRRITAQKLVSGVPFGQSQNDDDWLGHGIYFWEYAPQQAWWWAERRYGVAEAAVVGALVRLGRCIDLLDPCNADLLKSAHDDLEHALKLENQLLKNNANTHKYRDCAVFNYLYERLERGGYIVESSRAVFVPLVPHRGLPRLWDRSGIFSGAHIQICIREPANILAAWSVRKDGRYGQDEVNQAGSDGSRTSGSSGHLDPSGAHERDSRRKRRG